MARPYKIDNMGRRNYGGKPSDIRAYLDKYVPEKPNDACWVWIGPLSNYGYGAWRAAKHRGNSHKIVYEYLRAVSILGGFCLDHLCRNRRCVNPDHMEIVNDRREL